MLGGNPLATVKRWRSERIRPVPLYIGRHVPYRRSAVEGWLNAKDREGRSLDGLIEAMAQTRIPRGSHGEIKIKQLPDGRWAARAQVRDIDGRIRSVRVTETTKGAVSCKIQRRLAERVDLSVNSVTPDTTVEALAKKWLQHRTDHGKVRTKGLLAPRHWRPMATSGFSCPQRAHGLLTNVDILESLVFGADQRRRLR
jgi:hypothetical protein